MKHIRRNWMVFDGKMACHRQKGACLNKWFFNHIWCCCDLNLL